MAQAKRPKGRHERIRIDQLICSEELQQRKDGLDHDHADGIRLALKENRGKSLERVKVRRVTAPDGSTIKNYVTDGFHTVEGYRLAGINVVPCDVLAGTWDDAFYDSCGANSQHMAKNRTPGDKTKAVRRCIEHSRKQGEKWSTHKIADVCNVSQSLVVQIMQKDGTGQPSEAKDPEKPQNPAGQGEYTTQRRHTKERSASDPIVPITSQGGWREMPLGEFLEVGDYMWDNFKRHSLETAGQLHDAMKKGRLIGFQGGDHGDCWRQLEAMRTKQEVKPSAGRQGAPVYDWAKMDNYFGVVVRMVDEIGRVYPEEPGKPELEACHRNLQAFRTVFDQMKARLTKSKAT